jgi:hypothetical protein
VTGSHFFVRAFVRLLFLKNPDKESKRIVPQEFGKDTSQDLTNLHLYIKKKSFNTDCPFGVMGDPSEIYRKTYDNILITLHC